VNEKGEAFPSEQTIAILSGLTDKVVREGIRGLDGFPGFSFEQYVTRHGRRSNKFKLEMLRNSERGAGFPFFRYGLEAGCWREAKPAAKALYPVMRLFAFFDLETCADEDDELGEFHEVYANREFDLCEAEIPIMATFAGITRQSVYSALADLQRCCLVEQIDGRIWKVFLRSNGEIFKRDYLNECVRRSYGYLL
jgi:hypothetical protein